MYDKIKKKENTRYRPLNFTFFSFKKITLYKEFKVLMNGERGTWGAPEHLRQGAHRAGNTEQHSVILEVGEAVVPQQHAGVRVHVGVRVLGLAVLGEQS